MLPAPEPRPPRPADLAIVGNIMLTGLLRQIWELDYQQLTPDMGTSLVLMMLHMRISIATAAGNPLSNGELAELVRMAPTTVRNYVAILKKHHRVKLVAGRKRGLGYERVIVADLDRLDGRITLKHAKFCLGLIETCSNDLKQLITALMPELIANGKRQAAE